MLTPRVRSCELFALTAVLVELEQQNPSDLVCGEEKTRRKREMSTIPIFLGAEVV